MLEDQVRWVAEQLGFELEDEVSGTGWIPASCPFSPFKHDGDDENPSFAISVTTDQRRFSTFTCLGCHSRGSLSSLAYQLGNLRHRIGVDMERDYVALGQKIEEMEIYGVPEELPDWDEENAKRAQPAESAGAAGSIEPLDLPFAVGHPYLGKRGIHWNTAIRLGLLHDPFQRRILFPVHDYRGRLRGYTGRAYATTFLRNGKPAPKVRDYLGLNKRELLLGEHGIHHRPAYGSRVPRIIVVEGLFDYARLIQFGVGNVVALLGSELTLEKAETLKRFNMPIVWMTDPDPAGQACLYGPIDPLTDTPELERGALHKLYHHVPQLIVDYPRPVDPGELSRAEVMHMLRNAELYIR
jgi:Toprim domain